MKTLKITESCLVNGEHAEAGSIIKNVDNTVDADLVVNGRAVENHTSGHGVATRWRA